MASTASAYTVYSPTFPITPGYLNAAANWINGLPGPGNPGTINSDYALATTAPFSVQMALGDSFLIYGVTLSTNQNTSFSGTGSFNLEGAGLLQNTGSLILGSTVTTEITGSGGGIILGNDGDPAGTAPATFGGHVSVGAGTAINLYDGGSAVFNGGLTVSGQIGYIATAPRTVGFNLAGKALNLNSSSSTLLILFHSGYSPTAENIVLISNIGTLTGTFSQVQNSGYDSSQYELVYDTTAGQIRLDKVSPQPSPEFKATTAITPDGDIQLSWPSKSGMLYNVRAADSPTGDPSTWAVIESAISPSGNGTNSTSIPLSGTRRFFVIEEYTAP